MIIGNGLGRRCFHVVAHNKNWTRRVGDYLQCCCARSVLRERIHSIVVIAVERALPVTSPAYDVGATEVELRAIYRERLLS